MTELNTQDKTPTRRPLYVGHQMAEDLDLIPSQQATPEQNDENFEQAPERKEKENLQDKTRYDFLKAHYDKVVPSLRKEVEELKNTIANMQRETSKSMQLPSTPEDINAWRKEFPEMYDIMKTIALMETNNAREEVESLRTEVLKERSQSRREKAEATLMKLHPDWMDIRNDPDFHAWAQEQPSQIQDWLYKNEDDAHLASKAIVLYKTERGKLAPPVARKEPASRRDATLDVVSGSGSSPSRNPNQKKIWTNDEIAKLSPREFEKYERDIEDAILEGRVR